MRIFRPLLLLFCIFIVFISACELPQGATTSNSSNNSNSPNKNYKNVTKVDTTTRLSPQQIREQMKNTSRETVPAEMMVKGNINSSNKPIMMDSIP